MTNKQDIENPHKLGYSDFHKGKQIHQNPYMKHNKDDPCGNLLNTELWESGWEEAEAEEMMERESQELAEEEDTRDIFDEE